MGWLRAERTTSLASRPHLRSYVASDSLVDDWGCLNNGPERKAIPGNINLQCRRPLNSPLDQRLGERDFNILL